MVSKAYNRCVTIAVAVLLIGSTAVAAPTPRAQVRQIVERLVRQLYFKDAMKVCKAALGAGGFRRDELLPLLELQGIIAASQGRAGAAVEAFKKLLAVAPERRLRRGLAPRITRAFRRARAWLRRHPHGIRLALKAPRSTGARDAAPIDLEVSADPLGQVAGARLYARRRGSQVFHLTLGGRRAGRSYSFRLAPRALGSPSAIEYYVVALDARANELATVASASAPRSLAVERAGGIAPRPATSPPTRGPAALAKPTPWYKSWWFWSAVGVVLLGAGFGVGYAAARAAPDTVDGTIQLGVPR